MAYEVGTASNAGDLLLKLETFLTTNPALVAANQQWQSMKDSVVNPYTQTYDMAAAQKWQLHRCFVGKGLDGRDNIVVPMALYVEQAQTYYTLCAWTARSWDKTKSMSEQFTTTGVTNNQSCMSLWNAQIPYWFFANGRRFIVIAKIANRYMSLYAGFVMPCGTDREYSYPLYVGANHTTVYRSYQHDSLTANGSFWRPAVDTDDVRCSGAIVNPQGLIVRCSAQQLRNARTGSDPNGFMNQLAYVFPYHYGNYIGKTPDNNYVLKPIELVQAHGAYQCLGWLDNAFYISGFENSPESIVTVNGEQYICFPSMVSNTHNDYCAIKME
nr:MAG TPA: hypothetical protein [Caudoviricetes sp.]